MTTRLAALFVTALLGLLLIIGLALSPLGWIALVPYLALVSFGLGMLVRRARSLKAKDSGHTCTCCTSTVFDPVEVR